MNYLRGALPKYHSKLIGVIQTSKSVDATQLQKLYSIIDGLAQNDIQLENQQLSVLNLDQRKVYFMQNLDLLKASKDKFDGIIKDFAILNQNCE